MGLQPHDTNLGGLNNTNSGGPVNAPSGDLTNFGNHNTALGNNALNDLGTGSALDTTT